MDRKSTQEKEKKLLILLIIVVLVPVVLLILQFFQGKDEPLGIVQSPRTIQSTTISKIVSPTLVLQHIRWTNYETSTFQMQYPADWTATAQLLPNGGEAVTIRPAALAEGYSYPQFILQAEPASAKAMKREEDLLSQLAMTKSDVIVEGTAAIKYKGTLPHKQPIQNTTILLQKNKTLYVFKYEYEDAAVNLTRDEYFNEFIKTFRSKKK